MMYVDNKVKNVRKEKFEGFVYNFCVNEANTYYAMKLLCCNCRCSWLMVPPDELNLLDMTGINFTRRIE